MIICELVGLEVGLCVALSVALLVGGVSPYPPYIYMYMYRNEDVRYI